MTALKKPRRVRRAQCPWCGFIFTMKRVSKEDKADGINIQICPNCFRCLDGHELRSTLVDSDFPL